MDLGLLLPFAPDSSRPRRKMAASGAGAGAVGAVSKEIKFLAVARRGDKAVLCHRIHTSDKSYDYLANVNKVLGSSGWASVTGDKLSLDDGGNMFYVLIDEQGRVYIAITSKGYPSRFIYSSDGNSRGVLGALKKEVLEKFPDASLTCGPNGLDSKIKPLLKALCDEFNDIKSIDKIASVQQKVDQVTGVMQKNIELALKNTDRLEDIDEKAVQLADSAAKFKSSAVGLKRKMQCRMWQMYLFFGVIITCIIGGIVGYYVNQNKDNKGN